MVLVLPVQQGKTNIWGTPDKAVFRAELPLFPTSLTQIILEIESTKRGPNLGLKLSHTARVKYLGTT